MEIIEIFFYEKHPRERKSVQAEEEEEKRR